MHQPYTAFYCCVMFGFPCNILGADCHWEEVHSHARAPSFNLQKRLTGYKLPSFKIINHYCNNKAGNRHKLSRNTNALFLRLRGIINHRDCLRLTRSRFFKHPAVNPEETQLELQLEYRHKTIKSSSVPSPLPSLLA